MEKARKERKVQNTRKVKRGSSFLRHIVDKNNFLPIRHLGCKVFCFYNSRKNQTDISTCRCWTHPRYPVQLKEAQKSQSDRHFTHLIKELGAEQIQIVQHAIERKNTKKCVHLQSKMRQKRNIRCQISSISFVKRGKMACVWEKNISFSPQDQISSWQK